MDNRKTEQQRISFAPPPPTPTAGAGTAQLLAMIRRRREGMARSERNHVPQRGALPR